MNNPLCPVDVSRGVSHRILIENTIITVSAILKADYNPTARKLTLILIDRSELNYRDDLAESTWDFLTNQSYGCTEPLPLWEISTNKPKTTFHRSSEFRTNE